MVSPLFFDFHMNFTFKSIRNELSLCILNVFKIVSKLLGQNRFMLLINFSTSLYKDNISSLDTNFVQTLHCQIDVLCNGLIGRIRPQQFLTVQFNAANFVPNS